jgi:HrpA-like RNA helicase
VTTGILLNKLISRRNIRDFTHIIVDEVHEQDLNIELLLIVLKKLIMDTVGGATRTKLILMSATLNAKKLQRYFQGFVSGMTPVITLRQPPIHKIHEYFLDTITEQYVSIVTRNGQTH